MNKQNTKAVILYAFSFICIGFYFYLENSDLFANIVQKSENTRYGSFPTFFVTGLFKYGLLAIGIGILLFVSFFFIKEKLLTKSKEKRDLTLLVSHDFGQIDKTITDKATKDIIINTMNSVNWNEFHIVQLIDENENSLHVSGSLIDDGLASGFITKNEHVILEKPIETVNQMTEILLDFLRGESYWRNKYKYV